MLEGVFACMLFLLLGLFPYAAADSTVSNTIKNPLAAKTFEELIVSVIKSLLPFVSALAVLALVWTGFKFITAAVSGKPDELTKAKHSFFWILAGTALAVGAYVIAEAVIKFMRELK